MSHRICRTLIASLVMVVAHAARADVKDDLVGTWEWKHAPTGLVLSMTLNADGSGTMDEEPMRWSATSNTLSVVQDGETTRYNIKLDGNALHASGGDLDEPVTFARKGAGGANAKEEKGGLGGILQEKQEPAPPTPQDAPHGSGTWVFTTQGQSFKLDLKPDGTGSFNNVPLKWKLDGDALRLEMNGGVVNYEAKLTDDTLSLNGGDLPQAILFRRRAPRAEGEEKRDAPAAEPTIVGQWNSKDGPVELRPDGTGTINGTPVRYKLEPGIIIIFSEEEGVTRIPHKLDADGNRMTVVVDGEQGVLTRVGAGAAAQGGAIAGGDAPPGAGVYVAYESSIDPNFMMSYTQYLVLWPDGTVGWAKAEGGATRTQVTDSLERFTSFKTNPQLKGRTLGTWESDGTNVVVRWNIWNNLVCRGQFNGGALHLEKMGVIEEGATLKFEKQ